LVIGLGAGFWKRWDMLERAWAAALEFFRLGTWALAL